MIRRPCLNCGTLTASTTRCPTCQRHHDNLYDSDYRKRAERIRRLATHCHICGEGPRTDDPWTADHIRPTDPNSPLAPAHRSCNIRKGNSAEW